MPVRMVPVARALLLVALLCAPACGPYASGGPAITALTPTATSVRVGGTIDITAGVSNPSGGTLTYTWTAENGTIEWDGASATWTAPSCSGTFTIACTVTDSSSRSDTAEVELTSYG